MKTRGAVMAGLIGLLTFPLAGAALVARLLEPLGFVAVSLVALAAFGASTMVLPGAPRTREHPGRRPKGGAR